jgi:hypothetical protein
LVEADSNAAFVDAVVSALGLFAWAQLPLLDDAQRHVRRVRPGARAAAGSIGTCSGQMHAFAGSGQ